MVSLGPPPAVDPGDVRAFAGPTNLSRAFTSLCTRPYLDPPAWHPDPYPSTSNESVSCGIGPSSPEGGNRMVVMSDLVNRSSCPAPSL